MYKRKLFENSLFLFLPLFFTLLIEWLHRGSVSLFWEWGKDNLLFLLYTYILMFSILNIWIIFIRNKKYLYIFQFFVGLIFSILAFISNLKIELRGEPLSILDYKLFKEALAMSKEFEFNIISPLILGITTIIFIILIVKKVSGKVKLYEAMVYSGFSFIVMVIAYCINIHDFGKIGISVPADTSFNHEQNGFILASAIDIKFLGIPKPKDYSRESITNTVLEIKEYNKNLSQTEKDLIEPNIIFIMSESFSDLSKLLDLNTNIEVIPNFKELQNKGIKGNIIVPNVGGGTANTEFEVLTGFSKNNIPDYTAPYNPYNTYIYNNIPSLASEFANNNYETLAIHTYHSWFYRRNSVYKYLGFKQFLPLEFIIQNEYYGRFLDDKIINDLIIDQIKKTQKKDFIFAVTMAAHGPYDIEQVKEIKVMEDLKQKGELENYLNAIHQSDKNLGELIDYFRDYNEPTVVVFFGDHIPPLGNVLYEEMGVNLEADTSRQTPFLIWSNYDTLSTDTFVIDANLLGALVLKEIGYNKSDYFTYLTQALEEKNEEFKNNVFKLQYDLLHGNQYAYLVNEEYQNENYVVGKEFKIKNVRAKSFKEFAALEITGENLFPGLSFMIGKESFPMQYKDSTTVYTYIPIDDLKKNKSIEVAIKDSRNTVIKKSNSISIDKIETLDQEMLFENWYSSDLNEQQYWELFTIEDEYIIVRLQLNEHALNDERPYFVHNNGSRLENKNADDIDAKSYSDIYVNGYLYISIPKISGSKPEETSIDDIKEYFRQENYVLYTMK